MLQKVSTYVSVVVTAFLLLSSSLSIAQDSEKVWAVGMNYHNLHGGSKLGYDGLNISIERTINDHLSTIITGSYFFEQDINRSGFGYSDDFTTTAKYIAIQLKADLFSLEFFDFYGKTGVSHYFINLKGINSRTNDWPPFTQTLEYDRNYYDTGFDLGFGFEIQHKIIFITEVSLGTIVRDRDISLDYLNILTGIKIPLKN
jgi:hypothetical protein